MGNIATEVIQQTQVEYIRQAPVTYTAPHVTAYILQPQVKSLAAEVFRVGGIFLNNDAVRFANEWGRCDYVIGKMLKKQHHFC